MLLIPDLGGTSVQMHTLRHAGHIVNETRHHHKIVAGHQYGEGKFLLQLADKGIEAVLCLNVRA